MDEKRLAEIKARAEAANDEPTGWQEFDDHAREDVPFLLEQLEKAQHQIQGAHYSLRDHMLMAKAEKDARESALSLLGEVSDELKEAQGQRDQACAVVGEFQAEATGLRAKLAASESAAGAMRATLGELLGVGHNLKAFAGTMLRWNEPGVDFSDEARRIVELVERQHETLCVALSTEAGKDWLSPEEAEKRRKELERPRIPIWKTATGQSLLERNGYVSEEECARRCREVGEALEAELMKRINEMGIDLDAIIDRVAKGGAR